MKVTVIYRFFDKEADMKLRLPGETLEVTKARAEYLANAGVVQIQKRGGDPKSPTEAEG